MTRQTATIGRAIGRVPESQADPVVPGLRADALEPVAVLQEQGEPRVEKELRRRVVMALRRVGTVPLPVGTVPLPVGTVPLPVGTVPLPVGTVPLPVGMGMLRVMGIAGRLVWMMIVRAMTTP